MGVITGSNYNNFTSASEIYAKVRRRLESFSSTNEIDEGEFPTYTAEILNAIGESAMTEEDAAIIVEDYKGCLPDNFMRLEAAYLCSGDTGSVNKVPRKHLQGTMWNETEISKFSTSNKCKIDCCEGQNKLIERVVLKTYVGEDNWESTTYAKPTLLRLSPNVNRNRCAKNCLNLYSKSMDEITIDRKEIFSNFESGVIYMKYYGFPLDEDGLPEIPEISQIAKAIEYYILYQVLLNWWWNSSVPDLQTKWQKAEQEYEKAMGEVRYYCKLPAFSTLINAIRRQRAINKVSFFSSNDRKR